MKKKIIFCHGMGNQSQSSVLKPEWDEALFGVTVDFTSMAYWADILHPAQANTRATMPLDPALNWITDIFTKRFTPDVYTYLTDAKIRAQIDSRITAALEAVWDTTKPDENEIVILAHSLGCVAVYHALCVNPQYKVQLVTIGNPLGLLNVRASLRVLLDVKNLIDPSLLWLNFYDKEDPVNSDTAVGSKIAGVIDHVVDNSKDKSDGILHHSIIGYLKAVQPHLLKWLEFGNMKT